MFRCAIKNEVERPQKHIVDELKKIPVATISDALGRYYTMTSEIKPIFEGAKIAGPAITVREVAGGNLMTHKALEIANPGDVIVIDAGGYKDRAILGYIMASVAQKRGIEGVVIDGACRDVMFIREIKYPVFARGINPAGPHKGVPGEINFPIQCGGVNVNPGDIIVGDDDGVVVVPKERAEEAIEKSHDILKKESEWLELIKMGATTAKLLNVDEELKRFNVKYL